MVILHPRAGSQYRDQLDEAQPSTVWGGQPSLSMLTNRLLWQRESNLGVVHESNEPYPLRQAPVGSLIHLVSGYNQYLLKLIFTIWFISKSCDLFKSLDRMINKLSFISLKQKSFMKKTIGWLRSNYVWWRGWHAVMLRNWNDNV